MVKLNITKENLFDIYQEKICDILDECDWKTSFDPIEICSIICGIIYETDGNIYNNKTVYQHYMERVNSLNIDKYEWIKNYTSRDIVYMIYDLIEEIN